MNILFVNALLQHSTGGGLAERTLRLSDALQREGESCTILTLDVGLDDVRREQFSRSELVTLPCINRRHLMPYPHLSPIRRGIDEADVIQLYGHWTLLNAIVYRMARERQRPYCVCPAGALGIIGRSALLKRAYNRVVGRAIVRNAHGHVAITKGEMPEFLDYGVDESRCTVIPNGVDSPEHRPFDAESFRARYRLESKRLILFLGRLSYIKGPDLLLEAFHRIAHTRPEYDLVFAGPDDGMLRMLRSRTLELNLGSRVRFLGPVAGRDKETVFGLCDFLVIPSRKEAMSMVAIEAGIRSRPVLLTNQCGFDEIAATGGALVVEATVAGLADGLSELTQTPKRLPGMGAAICDHVSTHYTWQLAARAQQRLFQNIIAGAHVKAQQE